MGTENLIDYYTRLGYDTSRLTRSAEVFTWARYVATEIKKDLDKDNKAHRKFLHLFAGIQPGDFNLMNRITDMGQFTLPQIHDFVSSKASGTLSASVLLQKWCDVLRDKQRSVRKHTSNLRRNNSY